MAFTTLPLAGELPDATKLSSLFTELRPLSAVKTSDETVNASATLQNDDVLFLAVAANAVYHLEMNLRVTTNTTADFKFLFTFPAGLTIRYGTFVTTIGAPAPFPFALDQTSTASVEGNASAFVIVVQGIVTVSSTAGTLQLQWAQNTANASNTVVGTGSYLKLQQLS